jgi:two-component system chemotaxis response regulator CheB
VIGASAGGLAPLRTLLAALPANYPAAVFVVVHVAPESPSVLADILDRASRLPVTVARDGARIRAGTVTIATPDVHLMLDEHTVVLSHGARENRHRPSIDVLFRSAAVAFGPRVTGVVLSGMLDDGAAGLWAIKRRGGVAVVQDPDDAEFPDMPRNAMEVAAVDYCVSAKELAETLVRVASEPVPALVEAASRNMTREVRMAARNDTSMEELDALGQRVPFTCPECGGALWELEGGGPRFRCHVGHAYSLKTLALEQAARVEAALWAGLRKLEEAERLARRMETYARALGNERSASYHADMARASADHAETLRTVLEQNSGAADRVAVNE